MKKQKEDAYRLETITDNILAMNIESSEVVKHGINSFLALSVVFANNLSDICEESGANINNVIEGLKSDQRIGQRAYLHLELDSLEAF